MEQPLSGLPAPVPDERSGLLAFLAQQRDGLRYAAFGLTVEQATSTPTASSLTIAGLIKHAAHTERGWIDMMVGRNRPGALGYDETFVLTPGESLEDLFAVYGEIATDTEQAVAAEPDLGRAVPVPKGVPWFPDDVEAWSVRWVLLHLIEETARHAGHADITRESLDGATAFPLMAAAEGRSPSALVIPWSPAHT